MQSHEQISCCFKKKFWNEFIGSKHDCSCLDEKWQFMLVIRKHIVSLIKKSWNLTLIEIIFWRQKIKTYLSKVESWNSTWKKLSFFNFGKNNHVHFDQQCVLDWITIYF